MGEQSKPPVSADGNNLPADFHQMQNLASNGWPKFEIVEDREKFDPLKLFSYLVQHRLIVIACVVLGVVAGIVYTMAQTPQYMSTAKLEIAKTPAKVLQDIEVTNEIDELLTFETARQKLLSRDLAERVVKKLNLGEQDSFIASVPKLSLSNIFGSASQSSVNENLAALTSEQREARAISVVRAGLQASIIRNSSVLSIRFQHPVPEYTSAVVNQVARSFMDQNIENKNKTSRRARKFIQERVTVAKEKLEAAEKDLVNYAQEAGITSLDDYKSLVAQNIAELNKYLTITVDERLLAERHVEQLKKDGAATLPQVFQNSSIQLSKARLAELRATYKQKLATLKPGFPEMQKLRFQINEMKRNLQNEIASIGRGVEIKLDQLNKKEQSMRSELAQLEKDHKEYERKNIRYSILKREADSNRAQYQTLINKLNEVGIGAELKSAGAELVDAGQTPFAPFSPRLNMNVLISTFLFTGFGIFLIIILELLNNKFSIPDQIEDVLKVPTLGIIPRLSKDELEEDSLNSASSFAEAYRTLRTSVQFAGSGANMRHIVITSAAADEGKTTTSARLAIDFAALGQQVLVIDGDMRKPALHRTFGVNNAVGLSNLLSDIVIADKAKACFKHTNHPNLTILTAGTVPASAADLLASPQMSVLLQFLSKQFDMIIIDSPPIIGLSDAPLLSRLADATLMVVACKQTKREPARSAMTRLTAAGGNVVGAVLNKFHVDPLDYKNSYRHMRNNYYTYGEKPAKMVVRRPAKKKQDVAKKAA